MSSSHFTPVPARNAEGLSRQALQFFGISLLALTASGVLTWILIHWIGKPAEVREFRFPPAFAISSLLLLCGSYSLHSAVQFVSQEKQRQFRRQLKISMVLGVLFVGIQTYGIWSMFPTYRGPEDASEGVLGFVVCFASLHSLHFFVALMFVAFVIVRSKSDRYDHEYNWGVRFCAWFWHFLGVAWLAILAIFAIAL
ncbi:cytochrome c oxidase subunit 3 [Thalassoglobus sp.]|uniref:cytochrome c oxidase subunit 3 n=1 Tax=Thalassoglobus sp. TaxID=2795869 RepID=UPI003AA7B1D6